MNITLGGGRLIIALGGVHWMNITLGGGRLIIALGGYTG